MGAVLKRVVVSSFFFFFFNECIKFATRYFVFFEGERKSPLKKKSLILITDRDSYRAIRSSFLSLSFFRLELRWLGQITRFHLKVKTLSKILFIRVNCSHSSREQFLTNYFTLKRILYVVIFNHR